MVLIHDIKNIDKKIEEALHARRFKESLSLLDWNWTILLLLSPQMINLITGIKIINLLDQLADNHIR